MSEHGVSEAERVSQAADELEVTELVEGLCEGVDGRHEGAKPSELPRGRTHDREPAGGESGEPECEPAEGPRGARSYEDNVGRPDLEREALQSQGSATAGQLPEPADLPGIKGGVGHWASTEVEEEHARVTARGKVFEHRGWVVERVGG